MLFRKVLAYIALSMLASFAMAEPLMYVPSGESNKIVVIDLATDTVVGAIDELENAHGLSASANGEYLVAGSMQMTGADAQDSGRPSSVTEEEHQAHHAGQRPTQAMKSYVSIVDPEDGKVMRRIEVRSLTHHTAVSPNGKTAIAVHSAAGGISVIDLDRMAVTSEIQTGPSPNYALFTNDGKYVYVSNAGSGTVSEIATDAWRITKQIEVGREPEHMALAPDDQTLFVVNVGDGTVAAVNVTNGRVASTYPVGGQPHGADVSDDGRWLFAASTADGRLTRVRLKDGERVTATLQPAPYHLLYADAVDKVYVSSRKLPKIWVIDPTTLKPQKEIDIGEGVAHQMVVR